MKERPILFSPAMVTAIIAGSKTQTRRPIKPQPIVPEGKVVCKVATNDFWIGEFKTHFSGHSSTRFSCPYGHEGFDGKPGDRLYVRETYFQYGNWVKNGISKTGKQKYRFVCTDPEEEVLYMDYPPSSFRTSIFKTDPAASFWYKRNARFMPKKYARIWLEITDVRVERLQSISEEDCLAEGIFREKHEGVFTKSGLTFANYTTGHWTIDAVHSYSTLWNSINGADSWDRNDWVFALTFKRVDK